MTEKTKVLVLFQFDNHYTLIDALCHNLNKVGIIADSFGMVRFRFSSLKKNNRPWLLKILAPFMIIPKIRGLFIKFFRKKTILLLAKNYSIIDIHFFSHIYDELIPALKNSGKKIKITIWGSDFYRSSIERKQKLRLLFKEVSIIQLANEQMAKHFLKDFPESSEKVRLAHFGITQFDEINNLLKVATVESYKKSLGIPPEKVVIACGTNGHEAHQHDLIFEKIGMLKSDIKEKFFLVVPMTYGANANYIKKTKQKLFDLGLPNIVFTKPLSQQEICKIRIISDLAITIQKTDAFSAAIQEHILAGSILIAGEWLPYEKLKHIGVFFKTTSIASLSGAILEAIKNYPAYKHKATQNNEKMYNFSSWSSAISGWEKIYNELAVE